MMHENVVAHYRPKELIFSAKELISHGPTVGRTPILSVSLDRLPVAQKALARRQGNRVRRRMTACGKPERPHWVDSVEKLNFWSGLKNPRPLATPQTLGRGGTRDRFLSATKRILINPCRTHRVSCQLRYTLARI